MSEKTAGQLAYEATQPFYSQVLGDDDLQWVPWERMPAFEREAWEAAAQAAQQPLRDGIAALAARWDASAVKDDEAAAMVRESARQLLEERADTWRLCAADLRKLAGLEGQ